MTEDLLTRLTAAVVEGKAQEATDLTRQATAAGIEPLTIIEGGLRPGMDVVGERFSCGEAFIPHLVLAGRAMQAGMTVLEPELKRSGEGTASKGTAVIGTVRGDIHEIGKSLVGVMLTASGFVVHDLGVDVPVETFVARVRETGAQMVGLSALLTTTMVVQRRVIEALQAAGLRQQVKVLVGGAPVGREWAAEIGADGYAEDARGAVAEAKRLLGLA
ncbi:MAG TPA: corrinoid protein [Anaerolineales bacterium]|nr:corrinoid protein [Anaerolineales bacterium]